MMMRRNTLFFLTLLCLTLGFGGYHYIPLFWHVDLEWTIVSADEITKDRTNLYHAKLSESMLTPEYSDVIKEERCTLAKNLWTCQYAVTSAKALTDIQTRAKKFSFEKTGWVDPMLIRQDIVKLSADLQDLSQSLISLEEQIQIREKAIAPDKARIEKLIQTKDDYFRNFALRTRQLEIYEQILPQMDPSSNLYEVYVEEKEKAQKRVQDLSRDVTDMEKKVQKQAKAWVELAELQEKKQAWSQQMQQISLQKQAYEESLNHIHRFKAPHPRQYAFLPRQVQITPVRQASLFVPAFLSSFLILSNLLLWVLRRRRTSTMEVQDDQTQIDAPFLDEG